LGIFDRTEALIGSDKLEKLKNSKVAVFGIGGVGGYVCETLARSGIGELHLIDKDTVSETNINRQIVALHSTVGRYKTEVMRERIADINPDCRVIEHRMFYLPENADEFDLSAFDFVVDAIDTLSPKCHLIAESLKRHIKIISSMGAGAKSDVTQIRYADLWDTYHCGLSKAVRKRLQKMGIKRRIPVVFSTEQADANAVILADELNKKSTTGTISYLPAVFGCYLAQYVIKHL
jgi:tRNA A37 threonylcarbamoyladenosine dehydratase